MSNIIETAISIASNKGVIQLMLLQLVLLLSNPKFVAHTNLLFNLVVRVSESVANGDKRTYVVQNSLTLIQDNYYTL